MGLYFSGASVGMTVTLATSALFPSLKAAFTTAGVASVIITLAWIFLVKNKPPGAPDVPSQPVFKYIRIAARSKNVWILSIFFMLLMGSSMAYSGGLPNALAVRGIDPVQAGLMASIGTIGTIIGGIVLPMLSDKIGRIKPFLGPVCILSAFLIFILWLIPINTLWVVLPIGGFFAGAAMPLVKSYPILLPEIGPEYAGSAGGIMSTLQLLGAFFIPSFIISPIAGENFGLLLYLCAGITLVAGLIAFALPELGTKARLKAAQQVTGANSVDS